MLIRLSKCHLCLIYFHQTLESLSALSYASCVWSSLVFPYNILGIQLFYRTYPITVTLVQVIVFHQSYYSSLLLGFLASVRVQLTHRS